MTEKQKMKYRNLALKFMSKTGMMRNMYKTRRTLKLKKRKIQNQNLIKKTIQTKEKKLKRMKAVYVTQESQSEDEKKAKLGIRDTTSL